MTVYFQKKKRWWRYDFSVKGKRYTKAGYPTMKAALAAQEDKKKEILRGSGAPYATFADLVKDYAASSARTNTAEWAYQKVLKLNARFTHLATLAPSEIRRGHIERVLNDLARKRKPATVNEYLKIIRAVMNYAISMEAIDRNPTKGIAKIPDPRPRSERVKAIETVDLKKIILAAKPGERELIVVIAQTGARVREVLRLKWPNVHIEDPGGPFCLLTTRKSRGGHAKVRPQPLTALAARAIEAQRGKHTVWVFPGPNGELVYETALKRLKKLCTKAKVPPCSFHPLRHWAGTTAARMGKNKRAVADFLGQEDTDATEGYIHAARPEIWEVARRLEEELNADGAVEFPHTESHTKAEKANGSLE